MRAVANIEGRFSRLKRWIQEHLCKVLRENASPLRTSAGLALGAFVGIVPSFFVGSPLAFLIAGRLGLNRAAAVVGTLFTNPVTTPFFYSISTRLGLEILGHNEQVTAGEALSSMIRHYGAAFLVGNAAFACAFAITCGLLSYAFLFFRNAPHSADR